jgi:RHS repeat-associated protein
MGDIPVAMVEYTGLTERVTYLHADHLNTPRYATDETGTLVWQWSSDAFGNGAPNQDPDGDGTAITLNLRFPGQYYDAESGLHYNWNRYYDPEIGRYITSDPIGLDGGLNTFGYVGGNPLSYFDPTGLVYCGWWNDNCSFGDPPGTPPMCVTGDCSAGIKPQDPCSQCRSECAFHFFNPIPGIGIEKGAESLGGKLGDNAKEIAKDAAKKLNKIQGAYDLGQCLDGCKKTCSNINYCDDQ